MTELDTIVDLTGLVEAHEFLNLRDLADQMAMDDANKK